MSREWWVLSKSSIVWRKSYFLENVGIILLGISFSNIVGVNFETSGALTDKRGRHGTYKN